MLRPPTKTFCDSRDFVDPPIKCSMAIPNQEDSSKLGIYYCMPFGIMLSSRLALLEYRKINKKSLSPSLFVRNI